MEERITLTAPRARWLPRQMLLIAPSPFLEVRITPGSTAAATSATVSRSTEPVWKSFTYSRTVSHACGPITVALVVKDASSNDAVIGSVVLSIDAAQVEGWYPLGDSGAELYVRVTRATYCYGRWSDCSRAPSEIPMDQVQEAANGELRSVSSDVGFLFRNGELIVSMEAVDIPVSAKELQVVLKTDDQSLRGGEIPQSLQAWKDKLEAEGGSAEGEAGDAGFKSQTGTNGDVQQDGSEQSTLGRDKLKLRLRNAVKNEKSSAAAAAISKKSGVLLSSMITAKSEEGAAPARKLQNLVSVAGSYAMGLRHRRVDGTSVVYDIEAEAVQKEENDAGTKAGTIDEECMAVVPPAAEGQFVREIEDRQQSSKDKTSTAELKQPSVPTHQNGEDDDDDDDDDSEQDTTEVCKEEVTAVQPGDCSSQDLKRHVDFGSFRFALMQGIVPRKMHIQLVDTAAPLPAPLGLFQEHNFRIPNLGDFSCSCNKGCNTHIFRMRLNGLGPGGVTLLLRIQYKHWDPLATSTDVTNRFFEIFSSTDKLPELIRSRFPQAESLTYLFVGGLFTQHYPTYFERNISYLKDKLKFGNVEEVPIHTEGSIERNAKDIREAIMRANPDSKSIVLIGHSKGGVDAAAVVKMFPDVIPFLYGILTFQAPFGGTYLVDFVSRSKLAVNTISSAIEKLWKGDEAAFADMGYTARLRTLGITRDTVKSGSEASKETDTSATNEQSSMTPPFMTRSTRGKFEVQEECLEYLRAVPIVSFASSASFDVLKIRSAATAAGVATMAPAAQVITQYTGYSNDGLVTSHDSKCAFADIVLLNDMFHTEPALYVKGTNYPPGQLTASGLLLLFEKATRGV